MLKSKIKNIRSKVEKREIVQYLLLRERILSESIRLERDEARRRIIKARKSEMTKLINMIKRDTIRPVVKKLHQQIHHHNDYLKKDVNVLEDKN